MWRPFSYFLIVTFIMSFVALYCCGSLSCLPITYSYPAVFFLSIDSTVRIQCLVAAHPSSSYPTPSPIHSIVTVTYKILKIQWSRRRRR